MLNSEIHIAKAQRGCVEFLSTFNLPKYIQTPFTCILCNWDGQQVLAASILLHKAASIEADPRYLWGFEWTYKARLRSEWVLMKVKLFGDLKLSSFQNKSAAALCKISPVPANSSPDLEYPICLCRGLKFSLLKCISRSGKGTVSNGQCQFSEFSN